MISKDSPILITGATGFVGSYIVRRLLAAGYTHLQATRRSTSSLDLLADVGEQLTWHEASLDDYFSLEDAMEGIHSVIHCAALVAFGPGDAQRLLDINRRGTKYMIDAALHQKVEFFIQISSVAALGRDPHGQPVTEQTKWEDGPLISNYSRSKFLAEMEIWRGQAEGLKVASLYPTIILGAGRWQEGSLAMFDYASRGPKYFPSGATGFVDVRDVAEAALRTLERQQDSDRFLLNGANLTYEQVLGMLCQSVGQAAPIKSFPQPIARILAWLEGWRAWLLQQKPLLTRETVRSSYQTYVYDNGHSEDELRLQYRDLADTIRESGVLFQQTQGKESNVLAF